MQSSEREIEFVSEGVTCRGLFVRPAGERAPLIVLAHGLGGVYEMRLDAYARVFAAAGYAALTFDYRCFGRSDGRPRHWLRRAAQQADIEAAVAFGKTLDGVDPERVVLWGSSLAGGHMLDVTRRRADIAATIVQGPFTDGPASVRATSLASAAGTAAFALADGASRLLRGRPVLVPLAAPPSLPALMTKADVVQGVLALMPPGSRLSRRLSSLYRMFAARSIRLPDHVTLSELPETFEECAFVGSVVLPSGTVLPNGVSANFGLEVLGWRPGENLAHIRTPVLVCACEHDSVAPVEPTLAYARRGASTELRVYPYQHFEIYTAEPFERLVQDQLAFLRRVVPVRAAAQQEAAPQLDGSGG